MADARKLYLVDAMSNIHRAYHAIQRLSTSAGKPTNAIYGFINMLRKMLREHTPDYLAVAWDGPERTLRKDTYSEYKANRVPMASDLASQTSLVPNPSHRRRGHRRCDRRCPRRRLRTAAIRPVHRDPECPDDCGRAEGPRGAPGARGRLGHARAQRPRASPVRRTICGWGQCCAAVTKRRAR